MSSSLKFSENEGWIGHNTIFWTFIRYINNHKAGLERVEQKLRFPLDTGIKFCDLSDLTEEEMKTLKALVYQLRDEFDKVWTYDQPAMHWVGHLDNILELLNKRIYELSHV